MSESRSLPRVFEEATGSHRFLDNQISSHCFHTYSIGIGIGIIINIEMSCKIVIGLSSNILSLEHLLL